jgi:carboxylesterase
MFHGLTGTPSEMEELAQALFAVGCSVIAPLVPGHGRSIDELRRTTLRAWRQAAQSHFAELLTNKPSSVPVFVGGLSMGSFLALDLACENPEIVNGLVLLSPPLRLRSRKGAALLKLLSYLPNPLLNSLGSRNKKARPAGYLMKAHNSFSKHSTGALARLIQLKRIILGRIRKISCPTLIMYDPNDHHLVLKNVERFFSGLGPKKLTVREYLGGQHELTLGPRHLEVIGEVVQFVSNSFESNSR